MALVVRHRHRRTARIALREPCAGQPGHGAHLERDGAVVVNDRRRRVDAHRALRPGTGVDLDRQQVTDELPHAGFLCHAQATAHGLHVARRALQHEGDAAHRLGAAEIAAAQGRAQQPGTPERRVAVLAEREEAAQRLCDLRCALCRVAAHRQARRTGQRTLQAGAAAACRRFREGLAHVAKQGFQAGELQTGRAGRGRHGARAAALFKIQVAGAQAGRDLHERVGVLTERDADRVEHAVVTGSRAGGKRARHKVEAARNARAGQHAGQAGAQLVLGRGDTDGGKGRCRAAHQRIGRLAGGQQHGGRGQWRDVRRARSAGHGVDAEVIRPGMAAGLDPVRRRAGERDGGVVAVAIDGHIGGDHGAIGVEDAQLAAGDGRAHRHRARQCAEHRGDRHHRYGGRRRRRRAAA